MKKVEEMSDVEIREYLSKRESDKVKRYESNRKWRDENKEKVKQYHKEYNERKREFDKRVDEEIKSRELKSE